LTRGEERVLHYEESSKREVVGLKQRKPKEGTKTKNKQKGGDKKKPLYHRWGVDQFRMWEREAKKLTEPWTIRKLVRKRINYGRGKNKMTMPEEGAQARTDDSGWAAWP